MFSAGLLISHLFSMLDVLSKKPKLLSLSGKLQGSYMQCAADLDSQNALSLASAHTIVQDYPFNGPPEPRRCSCALQDAHEFLNYLLNECSELLEREAKAKRPVEPPSPAENADSSSQQEQQRQRQESGQSADSSSSTAEGIPEKKAAPPPTWIHDLFQVRHS